MCKMERSHHCLHHRIKPYLQVLRYVLLCTEPGRSSVLRRLTARAEIQRRRQHKKLKVRKRTWMPSERDFKLLAMPNSKSMEWARGNFGTLQDIVCLWKALLGRSLNPLIAGLSALRVQIVVNTDTLQSVEILECATQLKLKSFR